MMFPVTRFLEDAGKFLVALMLGAGLLKDTAYWEPARFGITLWFVAWLFRYGWPIAQDMIARYRGEHTPAPDTRGGA